MEEYLIFATIGGLLFLTLFVNSVAEAYEQKQRENRIKILKIKQGIDELGDLMDSLKNNGIGDNIKLLIANEIMVRLQTIQKLDKHFRGIQALIEEAGEGHENIPRAEANHNSKDEAQFKKNLIKLGRLIRTLNTHNWYSNVKPDQLQQYIKDVQVHRCEKIFQFYSDMANAASERENYMAAKEHYYYTIHALKGSGINTHPRVLEMLEQTEFMLEKTSTLIANNAKKLLEQETTPEGKTDEAQAPSPESTPTANSTTQSS